MNYEQENQECCNKKYSYHNGPQQIFLETVWNKYKQLSILQLNNIVMNNGEDVSF